MVAMVTLLGTGDTIACRVVSPIIWRTLDVQDVDGWPSRSSAKRYMPQSPTNVQTVTLRLTQIVVIKITPAMFFFKAEVIQICSCLNQMSMKSTDR